MIIPPYIIKSTIDNIYKAIDLNNEVWSSEGREMIGCPLYFLSLTELLNQGKT